MSSDRAPLCHPAAPAAAQSVQGVKDASPGGGSQVPWHSHSSPHQPGHQKGQEQSSSRSASVDGRETWGNGEKFMRRGVCLLSSQCGAADTMDLSSFIPPLICVPAPHCGRLIMDRKGRETLQPPAVHLEGGSDSSLDPSPTAFPTERAQARQLPALLRGALSFSSMAEPREGRGCCP